MIKENSHQQGRTFIETIAYIMVMITVTVSFASLVSRGYYKYECSAIQQELTDLKKTISMRYSIDGQYANVKWDDLCEDGIGPRSLMPERICSEDDEKVQCRCSSQRGLHTFDGPVNIGPSDCNSSNTHCNTFFIEFKELPQDICAQLASKAWDTMDGSDLDRLKVNNTTWGWPNSPITDENGNRNQADKEFPVLVDDAIGACIEGYENKITWYFN
ncbi:MAG TPA: hypothetical protein DIC64_02050 [Alphaproteobacteria bacterium]|nr:hypothetical protein [Alphaproteobacteria bacterium]